MKRSILGAVLLAVILCFGSAAQAADANAVKASLMTVRENTIGMLDPANTVPVSDRIASSAAAAAQIDAAAAAPEFKAFKEAWDAFNATRTKEIIPLIQAGKRDDAKVIATGIQAERMKKMLATLAELGAK